MLWNGKQVILIDHSYALPIHTADETTLVSSPLFPEPNVREHCTFSSVSGGGSLFDSLFEKWQAVVGVRDLEQLRSWIPASWERSPGDLERIWRFLSARPTRFVAIQNDLKRIVQ